MPVIELDAVVWGLGGRGLLRTGRIEGVYWAGDKPYTTVVGKDVVTPSRLRVEIVDQVQQAELSALPTDGNCCVRWQITENGVVLYGPVYTTVPDVETIVFGDLPIVDPATFAPTDPTPTLVDTIRATAAVEVEAQKGAPEGVAGLGADGSVPLGQIPMQGIADSAELKATFGAPATGIISAWDVTAPAAPVHTARIQAAIDDAAASGIGRVLIPQLDPADASVPWVLDGTISLPSGLEVDASSARIHTTTLVPAFEIADGVHDVTLTVMYCAYGATRPSAAAQSAATRTFVGVQNYGTRTTVRGHFEKFRAGVRAVRPDLDTSLAESNTVDITVKNIDFGIVYNGQRGSSFTVRGSYSPCTDSADPPHLVYATQNALAISTNVHVNASAWDSTGGEVVKIREHGALTSDYIIGTNVPAVLWIENAYAPQSYGTIAGFSLSGLGLIGNHIEAVRSEAADGFTRRAVKTAQSMILDLSSDIDFTDGRAFSTTDGHWDLPSIRVTCDIDTPSGTQALLHFAGDNNTVGATSITNSGTGGILGIRFRSGSGHRLTSAPSITGMYDGVYVHTDAVGVTAVVDRSLITASNLKVNVVTPKAGIAVVGAPGFFPDRWYPVIKNAVVVNATPTLNTMYAVRMHLDAPMTFDKFGVQVVTAAASATMLAMIYADSGRDSPFTRLWLSPSALSLAATGNVLSGTLATPVTVPAGDWWFAYVVQGAAGAVLTGAPRASVAGHAPVGDPAAAFSGATIARGSVTGTPNNPFTGGIPTANGNDDVVRFILHTVA